MHSRFFSYVFLNVTGLMESKGGLQVAGRAWLSQLVWSSTVSHTATKAQDTTQKKTVQLVRVLKETQIWIRGLQTMSRGWAAIWDFWIIIMSWDRDMEIILDTQWYLTYIQRLQGVPTVIWTKYTTQSTGQVNWTQLVRRAEGFPKDMYYLANKKYNITVSQKSCPLS